MTFQAGSSGNPKGRPQGSGCRQQIFQDLVMPHKEALVKKAISLAQEGDTHMLRLFLERILPAKPSDEPITLQLPSDENTTQAVIDLGKSVLRSLHQGEITPDQAKATFAVIKGYRDHVLVDDIAKQVDEMNEKLEKMKERKSKHLHPQDNH